MATVLSVFKPTGELAQAITNFQPRAAQQQMAEAIAATVKKKGQLVVEAETGTGKTFAYLAPVLLGKGKAIISTGTKNLQEQLFHRDLPTLRKVLAPEKVVALLKGRSNYLCLHRMEQATQQAGQFSKDIQNQLITVKRWSTTTRSGDMGELNALPEDAAVRPQVTSTQDNCLGRDCPVYEDCHLVKARKEAMEADIVVVNHHLFFADMALKDTGFGELIPSVDTVVFDEAHQIPDIASQYFGETVSSRQLTELCEELQRLCMTELKDLSQASAMARTLLQTLKDWRLLFPRDPMRGNWRDWRRKPEVAEVAERVQERLTLLTEVMKTAIGRNKDFDNLHERAEQHLYIWRQLMDVERTGYSFWFETTPRHVSLHQTPLSVAKTFGGYIKRNKMSWVFTSATLAVNGQFDYFTKRLGIEDADTLLLESPFDFARQAKLCLPRYLPEANDPNRHQMLTEIAEQCVKVNRGGTFLLFTSHRMLQQMASILRERLDRDILVQGELGKTELLETFTKQGNAVLLGTSSFWEGVDVRGDALKCVIIDKLPFASPDDPLLNARVEDARLRGVDAFSTIQLPQAIIALKQGAGRLIRDKDDSGVLIVCDSRLVTRQYGKQFLSSLPAMSRTRNLNEALSFLAQVVEKDETNDDELISS
ncbi:ATP-dependent DNA helicase [Idiomarina sp. HP20-50]|uniref:ATP-dependent DNA helicase n=1 Tax=Idiomarina sp. HP20-50 TaxID=3070813 RepID=UPI00294B6609|nr:ATP-dependent DNA helicase [Idiomarina sp. HP20-50]MDV6317177.1 ATP-dependent DNA helicase [Idiomarina sp. HP20-50]